MQLLCCRKLWHLKKEYFIKKLFFVSASENRIWQDSVEIALYTDLIYCSEIFIFVCNNNFNFDSTKTVQVKTVLGQRTVPGQRQFQDKNSPGDLRLWNNLIFYYLKMLTAVSLAVAIITSKNCAVTWFLSDMRKSTRPSGNANSK